MISVLGDLALPDLLALDLPSLVHRYVEIRREHGQVINLLAVIDGQKPTLDDWIPVEAFPEFNELCREDGLTVRAGIQFEALSHAEAERVVGANTLTTTRARATEIGDRRGSVHVFVGRDPATVEQTYRAGWYPLVAKGRASSKPWIDHYWFGEGLGYPECCLKAFAKNNNWSVNNMPYQAARASNTPSYLANSVMRFTGLTWASHLPCSYDCPATIAQSSQLRNLIQGVSPELARIVDRLTTGPVLLLSEWEAISLTGVRREGERIFFQGVSLVPSNRPPEKLYRVLTSAESFEIRDDLILAFCDDNCIHVEHCRTDGFAPRIPLVIDFVGPS